MPEARAETRVNARAFDGLQLGRLKIKFLFVYLKNNLVAILVALNFEEFYSPNKKIEKVLDRGDTLLAQRLAALVGQRFSEQLR